jgi:hypothetical protein
MKMLAVDAVLRAHRGVLGPRDFQVVNTEFLELRFGFFDPKPSLSLLLSVAAGKSTTARKHGVLACEKHELSPRRVCRSL